MSPRGGKTGFQERRAASNYRPALSTNHGSSVEDNVVIGADQSFGVNYTVTPKKAKPAAAVQRSSEQLPSLDFKGQSAQKQV